MMVERLLTLEVPRRDTDVVLLPRVVELCETPVDQAQLPIFVVNHHVVGLHVPVHYAHAVAVIQRLKKPIKC